MGGMLANFDARQVPPAVGIEPVPEGWYKVVIIKTNIKTAQSGNGGLLECQCQVIEGPHAPRVVYWNLNLFNNSDAAKDMAYKQLSAICHCIGVYQTPDQDVKDNCVPALHNRPFFIHCVIATGSQGPINNIKACKDLNGVEPGKQQMAGAAAPNQPPPSQQFQGAPPPNTGGWQASGNAPPPAAGGWQGGAAPPQGQPQWQGQPGGPPPNQPPPPGAGGWQPAAQPTNAGGWQPPGGPPPGAPPQGQPQGGPPPGQWQGGPPQGQQPQAWAPPGGTPPPGAGAPWNGGR